MIHDFNMMVRLIWSVVLVGSVEDGRTVVNIPVTYLVILTYVYFPNSNGNNKLAIIVKTPLPHCFFRKFRCILPDLLSIKLSQLFLFTPIRFCTCRSNLLFLILTRKSGFFVKLNKDSIKIFSVLESMFSRRNFISSGLFFFIKDIRYQTSLRLEIFITQQVIE